MKTSSFKILKIVIPLSIGLGLVWYLFNSATPEELKSIWNNVTNANPYWVGLSLFIGLLSHISRSYRWLYLIEPLGYKGRLKVSFTALMVGYLANLGIPRSGELLRAATLSNYDNIPIQKAIGTILTERVIDLIVLLLLVFLAFVFNTELLTQYFLEQKINPLNLVYGLLFLVIFLMLGFIFIKKIDFLFIRKVKNFILGVYEGMLSIFKMKKKGLFLLHTIFIWGSYILMLFVVKYSIPGLESLTFSPFLIVFVAGSMAMMTSNGGFGAYPLFVGVALLLFGIEKTIGEAYGWIIWGSQTLMNLIFGGLSFILLPIFSKKK